MKKALNLIVLLFACAYGYTQDSIPLPNQALKVVKQFQPKIENAKPIYISPKKRIEESHPTLNLAYNTPPQIFTISYPDPVIKPLVFEEEDKSQNLKDGYIKLGYGNNQSPLIESQMHYDIQDWFQVGYSVRHYSAKDTTPEIARRYANTLAEIYASYFITDQTKITADVHYQNDNRNWYGFGISDFMQTAIQLDNYGVALRVDHNSFSVKGFSTKHNLLVNRINSRFNEESEFHYGYASTTNKTIGKKMIFNLPLGVDYYASELWTEDPLQIQGRPNVFYKTDKFSVRAGAFLASNDTLYVRPHVELSYLLPWHNLEALASYEANSDVNSLHKFYTEMPYYNDLGEQQASFAEEELARLGVRWKNKRANLYLGGTYGNYIDNPLYVYITRSYHSYELHDFAGFGFELNGSYKFKKILTAYADLRFRDYELDRVDGEIDLINPYYIPKFEATLRLEQMLFKKLKVYQSLRYLSARSIVVVIHNSVVQADPIMDLGAGVEYLHKNRIGIFAEANNLLNESYEQFYLDKSFKLNYHLGIKFLF